MMNRLTITILLLSVLLAGCYFVSVSPPPPDYYYVNPDKSLAAIGKVAIIELDNESLYPKISADVTEALFEAIQKRQAFSLTVVPASGPRWRSLQMDCDSPHSLEQLGTIRKTLRCNAILVGTVTQYEPFPHLVIGLRLRLLDLTDGQLIWAIEQVWDSADQRTEYRIKKYFRSQMRSGSAELREQLVAVSSLKFIKYVAYEVGETLQVCRYATYY